jgi:hypothetical protein
MKAKKGQRWTGFYCFTSTRCQLYENDEKGRLIDRPKRLPRRAYPFISNELANRPSRHAKIIEASSICETSPGFFDPQLAATGGGSQPIPVVEASSKIYFEWRSQPCHRTSDLPNIEGTLDDWGSDEEMVLADIFP